jgi:hypothetical protein
MLLFVLSTSNNACGGPVDPFWRQGGSEKDVDKVGERLQGVGISTADGSSSTGWQELESESSIYDDFG